MRRLHWQQQQQKQPGRPSSFCYHFHTTTSSRFPADSLRAEDLHNHPKEQQQEQQQEQLEYQQSSEILRRALKDHEQMKQFIEQAKRDAGSWYNICDPYKLSELMTLMVQLYRHERTEEIRKVDEMIANLKHCNKDDDYSEGLRAQQQLLLLARQELETMRDVCLREVECHLLERHAKAAEEANSESSSSSSESGGPKMFEVFIKFKFKVRSFVGWVVVLCLLCVSWEIVKEVRVRKGLKSSQSTTRGLDDERKEALARPRDLM